MSEGEMTKLTKILLCGCVKYERIPEASLKGLVAAAENAGIEVELVPRPVPGCSVRSRSLLVDSEADVGSSLFSPGVRALYDYAGADAPRICDLRNRSLNDVLTELGLEAAGESVKNFPEIPGDWVPWFPTIDRERCVSAGNVSTSACLGYTGGILIPIRSKSVRRITARPIVRPVPGCVRLPR